MLPMQQMQLMQPIQQGMPTLGALIWEQPAPFFIWPATIDQRPQRHDGPAAPSPWQRFPWTVDARRLKSKDRDAVSPPHELAFDGGLRTLHFKIVIKPKPTNGQRGGH